MVRKRYSIEDALNFLREINVHLHDGPDVVSACRKAGLQIRPITIGPTIKYKWSDKLFARFNRFIMFEFEKYEAQQNSYKEMLIDFWICNSRPYTNGHILAVQNRCRLVDNGRHYFAQYIHGL